MHKIKGFLDRIGVGLLSFMGLELIPRDSVSFEDEEMEYVLMATENELCAVQLRIEEIEDLDTADWDEDGYEHTEEDKDELGTLYIAEDTLLSAIEKMQLVRKDWDA